MPIEEDGLDRASKCAIEHAAFTAHGAIAQVTSRTRARLLAFELRCGRSSEAEQQPSRLEGWVRFHRPLQTVAVLWQCGRNSTAEPSLCKGWRLYGFNSGPSAPARRAFAP